MSGLRIEGLAAAMRPDRLYPVQTAEGSGFYAGLAAEAEKGTYPILVGSIFVPSFRMERKGQGP